MKISFVIWYNNYTPQIVDVLKSIVRSSGPVRTDIVAVKTSIGKQLEDYQVRWMPRTRVVLRPGAEKRIAWQAGVNQVINKIHADYIVFCDPFFIANERMFDKFDPGNKFRFYVPYSNYYGETYAEEKDKIIRTNTGGSFILMSRNAADHFSTLPSYLNQYYLDHYMIDTLGRFGYTGHKISGCYVREIERRPPSDREKINLKNDSEAYKVWLESKHGGYNAMMENLRRDFD